MELKIEDIIRQQNKQDQKVEQPNSTNWDEAKSISHIVQAKENSSRGNNSMTIQRGSFTSAI